MSSRSAVLSGLLLLTATALDDEEARSSAGRRLAWLPSAQPIWGNCLTPLGMEGCSPGGDFQCSDRLSPGPKDADVQVVIGGLPASSAGEPVHLQFWGARKSPTEYNPLVSLVNCSIYADVIDAYPHFDAADFNGGNVLVSETGEATIRIRAPASYMILWQTSGGLLWDIPLPHIHLRLCYGNEYLQAPAHDVFFSEGMIWLASTNRPHLVLRSMGFFADRSDSAAPNASAPQPVKIVVGATPITEGSTTISPATTASLTPTSSSDERGVLIDSARNALDLDALEFSPVYRCLLGNAFFDHFTSSCSTECPAEAVAEHGQCVLAETKEVIAQVSVTWELEVNCGEHCWHDKKFVALHNVRLSAAGLLNIPFQEVEVQMGFLASGSRRLAGSRTAYLTVEVSSKRVTQEAGTAKLLQFVRSVDFISQLLGLDVISAKPVEGPGGELLSEPVRLDKDSDPYEPGYTALEPHRVTGHEDLLGLLPTPAVIGIAASVVVLLSVVVGSLVWRRHRAQRTAREAHIHAKVNAKIEEHNASFAEPIDGQMI